MGTAAPYSSAVFTVCGLGWVPFLWAAVVPACRSVSAYLMPILHSTRRINRRTPCGSASQQRDCRRQRREEVRTMRPWGRITAVMTATMSSPAHCSCRCAMFGHPVVAVACEGEAEGVRCGSCLCVALGRKRCIRRRAGNLSGRQNSLCVRRRDGSFPDRLDCLCARCRA